MINSFNTQIQPFFQWLLRSTVQASFLICLILLIQAILAKKFGARWSYWLWLILFIRMVIPWSPHSNISIFNILPHLMSFTRETSSLQNSSDVRRISTAMESNTEINKESKTSPANNSTHNIKTTDA